MKNNFFSSVIFATALLVSGSIFAQALPGTLNWYNGEGTGMFITDKWPDYYDIVLDKYNRRIERFKNIVNDPKPIIVLCRYSTKDVLQLQKLFLKYYKLKNIFFVNSSNELFENDNIQNINTEKNNVWNDVNIWNEGIDYIIKNKLLKSHFK